MSAPLARTNALFAKRSLVVTYGVMSLSFGGLFAASLAAGRPLGGGLLPLVVGLLCAIYFAGTPVVRVLRDHLEIKAAPLAARRLIAYDDVRGIEQPSAKKAFAIVERAGRTERVRLPLNLLTPQDGARLLALLRARPFARRAA